MKILDPGHKYELSNKAKITFIKRVDGKLIHNGTTNEELLEVLLDRTEALQAKFPCHENEVAINGMRLALHSFNERTRLRVTQGVETKDIPHVS
jgi:hypothetical protein